MRLRLGILALIMATVLVMVGCGSGTSTSGGQEDPTASAPSSSPGDRGAWGDYRDSLLSWAEDRATSSPPTTAPADGYDEGAYPDSADSTYRERVERELEDLRNLEQLEPPPELAALHQKLVEAFGGFCQADELYQETQAAKNYLAAIKAGMEAQEQLDNVNDALLQLVQALRTAE